ncbi:MAG TPA: phosphate signaling complex protein PhoU [Nitrospiraceae bacterium]|nr:phosphate signaling complex protein PhoU [Nitrospiraceae bacterium]
MQRHFDQELAQLKEQLLRMGSVVEGQIQRALESLVERDSELAQAVVEHDRAVNSLDVDVDDACIKLLALHQPAAGDLRFITTAMKISSELERMGDHAENIARRALELNNEPQLKPYIDIPRMGNWTMRMVQECLNAFVNSDSALARKVCGDDDYVDEINEQLFRELLSFMLEDPRTITRAIRLTFVAKSLERIADHATNIAELVVYMVEGKNIRHIAPPLSI